MCDMLCSVKDLHYVKLCTYNIQMVFAVAYIGKHLQLFGYQISMEGYCSPQHIVHSDYQSCCVHTYNQNTPCARENLDQHSAKQFLLQSVLIKFCMMAVTL